MPGQVDGDGDGGEPAWYRLVDVTRYGALGYLAIGVGLAAGGLLRASGRDRVDPAGWPVAFVVGGLVELLGYISRRSFWIPRAVEIERGRRAPWHEMRATVLRSIAARVAVAAVAVLSSPRSRCSSAWFCVGMAAGTALEVVLVSRWERRHGQALYRTARQRGLAVGPL